MTAEAWGRHVPSGVIPLGTCVLENEDGERPLDVWARLESDAPGDEGALIVLYQGGDVIAFPAARWDELVANIAAVRNRPATWEEPDDDE